MSPTFIAIIPARGGSKGVPDKNIRSINGLPMIEWTIAAALSVKALTRVIVSTDSERIATIARLAGAEVPALRPMSLALDDTPTEPVLIHAIENWVLGYKPDYVMLLQPTSPRRSSASIKLAIDELIKSGADSLVSVSRVSPFYWRNKSDPIALYDYRNRKRRQDFEEEDYLYRENGAIYITKTSMLLGENNRIAGKTALFEMPEEESLDVDNEIDLLK